MPLSAGARRVFASIVGTKALPLSESAWEVGLDPFSLCVPPSLGQGQSLGPYDQTKQAVRKSDGYPLSAQVL